MRQSALRFLLAVASCAAAFTAAHAMSVQPPSFPELVAEAATVARARVTDVASRFVTAPDGQRIVKTFVTFTTLKTLKGAPAESFTLEFLGGEAGGERWSIPGMPTFERGNEEFVFATGQSSVCPLVGAMHGRYRVLTEPTQKRRYVARDNLAPLTSTADVALPAEAAARALPSATAALSPEDFEHQILTELQRAPSPAAQR